MAQTPPGFVFAVKSSRYLTHIKRLTDMERGVARLLERLEPLSASPKMGPMLWQLPGNFRRDDERLAFALEHLPARAATPSSSATRAGSPTTSWPRCAPTASRWPSATTPSARGSPTS